MSHQYEKKKKLSSGRLHRGQNLSFFAENSYRWISFASYFTVSSSVKAECESFCCFSNATVFLKGKRVRQLPKLKTGDAGFLVKVLEKRFTPTKTLHPKCQHLLS